jgi:hypothetical protein
MKDRLCQYGNCQNYKSTVTLSVLHSGERPSFCSTEHAALYLLREDRELSNKVADMIADRNRARTNDGSRDGAVEAARNYNRYRHFEAAPPPEITPEEEEVILEERGHER